MRWALRATLYAHRHIVQFRVLYDSTLKPLVTPLFCVQLFVSRVSSHCKHDVGALSRLNVETVERAPTPLIGRLVRCSACGPFFGRLWYKWTCIKNCYMVVLCLNVVHMDGGILVTCLRKIRILSSNTKIAAKMSYVFFWQCLLVGWQRKSKQLFHFVRAPLPLSLSRYRHWH